MLYILDSNGERQPDIRNAAHGVCLLQSLLRLARTTGDKAVVARADHRHPQATALYTMAGHYAWMARDVATMVGQLEADHIHGVDCTGPMCQRAHHLECAAASAPQIEAILKQTNAVRRAGEQLTQEARPDVADVTCYQLYETVILEGRELLTLLKTNQDGPGRDPETHTPELDTARHLMAHIGDEISRLKPARRSPHARHHPQDSDSARRQLSKETSTTWLEVLEAMKNLPDTKPAD